MTTREENNMTQEELEAKLKEITLPEPDRKFVLISGCKTYGTVNFGSDILFPKTCDDPTCTICTNFNKALDEEFNNALNKAWKTKE